jgi:hypothetical protein
MPLTDHIRPEPNPPLTVERVTLARDMYVEGFTVSRICAQCLMSLGTLYTCLDGVPFGPDGLRFEPIPRRRNVLCKRTRPLRADPLSLRNRLIRTAEQQVREIELRLALPDRAGPDRERDVRMLALTVKSLRDLAHLSFADEAKTPPAAEEDDDEIPKDIDQFRIDLARRIDTFVKSRTEGEAGAGAGEAAAPLPPHGAPGQGR